jgi:hypothetical protein
MSRWFTIMNTSFTLDDLVRIVLDTTKGQTCHRLFLTFRANPVLIFELGAAEAKGYQVALLQALEEWDEMQRKLRS